MSREKQLLIGLDIDDVLAGFFGMYQKRFSKEKDLIDCNITKNVRGLRKDREFWMSLPKLRDIDFIPSLYCTKRINSKTITKDWLAANHFPERPIYQRYYQKAAKSPLIKGRVDVFIDDSVSNFLEMNMNGVPCLLMDADNNRHFNTPFRIYSLKLNEIKDKYAELVKSL